MMQKCMKNECTVQQEQKEKNPPRNAPPSGEADDSDADDSDADDSDEADYCGGRTPSNLQLQMSRQDSRRES